MVVNSSTRRAQSKSHAEGAESAEFFSHAEFAEGAEFISHAEFAEDAEFGFTQKAQRTQSCVGLF